MTSRLWVKLFLSTLLLGGVVTSITGFIVRWDEFSSIFMPFDFLEVLSVLFWLFGVGLIFSIISQMGFFAYLTIHRFGLGIFKSHKLWNGVQVVLILFVLFDLVYFRYNAFAEQGESLLPYIGLAAMLLAAGLITAFLKVRISTKETFIPALFFMIVVTTIEWVPILRVNEYSWVWLMIFPLIICNAYQLLILQKINEQSRMHRQQLDQKKNIPLKK
ncbi:KinB-signaling pathway activation protein [Cytobacillus gottheilii]|uniref:KinB-signaling pathway activation protein n=1 Tax=Cytobacillus gottheilii TaxID=859144 RepID=A0ABX8FCB1_9BACI|nr:KinB-signaling pathway activation protein [Cytobacillus gottheilii]QVY61755.1 KinB-signaling pathway activation protein [Cytobacillus gottheilii]